MTAARIHPTAIVEDGATIGEGTVVWDNVHVRRGATIGRGCIVGGKTYIAPHAVIGDHVKLNAFVYVCTGVTIERGVMVAAGVTFTNDQFPRATTPDLSSLLPSDADERTQPTLVREGATLGARATIGSDLTIGRFAMVGMGSVVTHTVGDFAMVVGVPARAIGYVCRCGTPVHRGSPSAPVDAYACSVCGRRYEGDGEGGVREREPT